MILSVHTPSRTWHCLFGTSFQKLPLLCRDCYQRVLKACLSFECRIFFLFAELGSSPTSSEHLNMLLAPASGNVEELIVVTARSSESLFRTGNATYEKGCAR